MRRRTGEPRRPIDVPGLVLLALAIVAFLVAIRGGAGSLGLVAALAVVPLLAVFVIVELRQERPAVDPRLFLQPAVRRRRRSASSARR